MARCNFASKQTVNPFVDPTTWVPRNIYIKKIHEPDYLELLKPEIPFYELVNCQVSALKVVVAFGGL